MEQVKEEVLQLKIKRNHPLIIEIPDRHGSRRGDDAITRYIKESIGIQI
jgi:V/A-type H+-transporting ATPase subunit F